MANSTAPTWKLHSSFQSEKFVIKLHSHNFRIGYIKSVNFREVINVQYNSVYKSDGNLQGYVYEKVYVQEKV